MKRMLAALCLTAGTCGMIPHVSATPTSSTFGVSGVTAVFNCPWNRDHTACNSSEFSHYNGTTVHTPTQATSIASDARGTARASGEISASTFLPRLRAFASSSPAATGSPGTPYGGSSRADANVWGVQGYTYTGSTPFVLTLTATLDSVFSRPDVDRQSNHSGVWFSLFDTAGYAFAYSLLDPATTSSELCPVIGWSPDFLGLQCGGTPAVYATGSAMLSDTGTVSATLAYMLSPGQSFFVGAFLDASACCGVTVDSSHTLEMRFNDASQLSSFAVPGARVPEPGTLLGVLLGLALLLACRRTRQSALSLAPRGMLGKL